MNFVGTSSSAIWRQRVYGGLGSFFFYLLLHFTGLLPLHGLALTFQIGSFILYFLAVFSSSPSWVRWTLAFSDMVTLTFLLQITGGSSSPFMMMIPVWFFGVALANLVDGQTKPIPWMLLMGAMAAIGGSWNNFSILTAAIVFTALAALGAGAATLSLERRAARRDPFLTILYNRAAGLERLEEIIKTGEAVSVAYIDLTDFKKYNDQFGHKIGDEILLEVAKRLIGAVRSSDLVVRMGGDEFLVASVQPNVQQRLEQIFSTPIHTTRGEFAVKGDVGSIAITRNDEVDAILERADSQMYQRKRLAKAALA